MMNNKNLSTEDIEKIRELLWVIDDDLNQFQAEISKIMFLLEDEAVVQSFFKSGLLGKEIKAKFDKLNPLLTSYIYIHLDLMRWWISKSDR